VGTRQRQTVGDVSDNTVERVAWALKYGSTNWQPEWAIACLFCGATINKPCKGVIYWNREPYNRFVHETRAVAFRLKEAKSVTSKV